MNTLPKEPSIGLLMSMAIRSDHALGCPGYYDQPFLKRDGVTHKRRLECAIGSMRQLYEEVSGNGFYSPDREDDYAETYRKVMEHDGPEDPDAATPFFPQLSPASGDASGSPAVAKCVPVGDPPTLAGVYGSTDSGGVTSTPSAEGRGV